jgi:hypothetical protein
MYQGIISRSKQIHTIMHVLKNVGLLFDFLSMQDQMWQVITMNAYSHSKPRYTETGLYQNWHYVCIHKIKAIKEGEGGAHSSIKV